MNGQWRAHVVETGAEWARNEVRLLLVQDVDGRTAVNMADHTMKIVGLHEAEPADAGWVLPREAWNAIVDMVQTTSRGEVGRLEEALAVERARVDRLIDAVADQLQSVGAQR